MSACSPLAASQGTPPACRSERSSAIAGSPCGELECADLVAQLRGHLELLALDRLLEPGPQRADARVALEQFRIRHLIAAADVLGVAMHAPQEVAEAVLERAVALR